ESVLVEWIGPFLGAQRRAGAGATVSLEFSIAPRDRDFVIFAGFEVSTDSNLTGGQAITFITSEQVTIPAGESTGRGVAVSLLKGEASNVAPRTITRVLTSLDGVDGVTNPEAAFGGEDPELLDEVKQRFFTLIRRRNPVSAEDWQSFFEDALGAGVAVNVLPRRSEKEVYRYEADYVTSNPSVSFFALNPDGTPLTLAQRNGLQNLIKFSLPIEFTGNVYSMEVDDVDIELTVAYDPAKNYATDLRNFSRTIRDSLFGILTPNAVFPISYAPSVSDVEGALTTSFPAVLGSGNQFVDPDIEAIYAYYTPRNMSSATFTRIVPKPFVTDYSLNQNDLVVDATGVEQRFFAVANSFNPVTGSKVYHNNLGDLTLVLIKDLTASTYSAGDVVSIGIEREAALHVVLAPFTYNARKTIPQLISEGLLSEAKEFTEFLVNTSYTPVDELGRYNPQLIEFERGDTDFETFEPRTPAGVPPSKRAGWPVWVVARGFTRVTNTTNLATAQADGFVSTNSEEVLLLTPGVEYLSGQYVSTPSPEEALLRTILAEVCYTDVLRGASKVYAKVLNSFTFTLGTDQTYKEEIDGLVAQGIIEIIDVVDFVDCAGRSSFKDRPFRYEARFRTGEYLRYRPEGGFDAKQLEECFRESVTCPNLSSGCKRLIEQNLPLPAYYYVLKDFTPNTQSIGDLVGQNLIEEVPSNYFFTKYAAIVQTPTELVGPETITSLMVSQGLIAGTSELSIGDSVTLQDAAGRDIQIYYWTGETWAVDVGGIPTYRDLFRFAPRDAASFRSGSVIRQYEATQHVTPILDLETYYDNGVFVASERTENVKYTDPLYHYEDVIADVSDRQARFYRAIRSFTPPSIVTTWIGPDQANSERAEEVFGNLLKFVVRAEGQDDIYSRLGQQVSAIKLGVANIKLRSQANKNPENNFVWESTDAVLASPQLSYFTGTQFQFRPVNYGNGTLAL
ncbi:MAG: hypothetical protein FJ275_01920, partial [Planctomycetes bacterium]|nr:hypothetical protein [Planctomycetota bacterium]